MAHAESAAVLLVTVVVVVVLVLIVLPAVLEGTDEVDTDTALVAGFVALLLVVLAAVCGFHPRACCNVQRSKQSDAALVPLAFVLGGGGSSWWC